MRFIIVTNYYYPEIGAAPNRITNLAEGLSNRGNSVDIVCPLPNYPEGRIFKGFRKKLFHRDWINAVRVSRYWVYPSVSKNPVLRIISMLSFSISLWAFVLNRKRIKAADWIIVQNPPLLVSFSAILLFRKFYRKRIALNVSDLWPLSALELGAMKRGRFYRLLEKIEAYNYRNARIILGQSNEILQHVEKITRKPSFLYRNIQHEIHAAPLHDKHGDSTVRIVYAGLLGVAQGILTIIEEVDFSAMGIEFDIYGHGNEMERIKKFIELHPNGNVSYKGSVSKKELNNIMPCLSCIHRSPGKKDSWCRSLENL